MEEYKRLMCSCCINKKCIKNITKTQKKDIIITKCENYLAAKKDNKKYLSNYIKEIKLRKTKC